MKSGRQEEKEIELENALVDAQEKSFLELLCEADPTIQLQAWESFGAYSPGFLSSSLTPWVPPSAMGPAGVNTQLELRGASSDFKFSEEAEADIVLQGYSGYNSRWALKMLGKVIDGVPCPPAAVTVFFGSNDAAVPDGSSGFQHVPLDEYKRNLQEICSSIKTPV